MRSEYDFTKDTWIDKKPTRITTDLVLLENQFKIHGIKTNPKLVADIKKNPAELYPTFTQFFPEQVLNPKNELARKVNRLWFD